MLAGSSFFRNASKCKRIWTPGNAAGSSHGSVNVCEKLFAWKVIDASAILLLFFVQKLHFACKTWLSIG